MAWLKKNTSEKPAKTPSLPQSLKAALNALDRDSLILDKNSNAIFKTNNVDKLNILKEGKINSEELSALVRVVRRTGVKQEGSFELPRGPIGEGKRELQVSVSMLSEAGLVLVMIDDEGEKQRIDAVRRDFITNISHELKTPITALSLNSDALLEIKNEPEQVVKFANKIKQQTGRLNDLVQEIINLSKLQDTDPMASAKEVQILDVVNEAIDQCETNAESHKITIDLEKSESAKVLGNREQLVMAVHNLIENAINYSPESTKVTVLIEVTEQIVEVTVKDQGIGIAQSEIDRIFERFYRVDQARSRATGGTGLGLSIVKHVAGNHGGEIKVWSVPGIGSTFSLRLPIISKVARTSK
jgi:two-component system, OmpR family, sensor histidine kinase SenX3